MRKIICMLLCLTMLLSILSACGTTEASVDSTETESSVQADAPETTEQQETETAEPETPASTVESSVVESSVEETKPAHTLPLTEEDVTFTMFEGMNPNLMNYIGTYAEAGIFKWLEENTGVHVEIPAVHPASQNEQFALMVASGDYADFIGNMSLYSGGLQGALDEEVIYDLTEFQDQMPLFFQAIDMYEDTARDCRLDSGAVVMTYLIYEGDYNVYTNGPVIRTDWLEELGMDVPHTYDEYYEVLTAFHNKYGATLWFSGSGSPFLAHGYGIHAGYSFGWMSGLDCFYQEDGVVQCGFLQDSFRDYLSMMQKWYTEGLIYPDYFIGNSNYASGDSEAFADVTTGKIGIWTEEAQAFSAYRDHDIEFGGAYFPVREEGDQLHVVNGMTRVNQQKYSVSTKCEDPELACQWLDVWYTDEATQVANWGIEGETFTYDENGQPMYTDLITNNPDGISMSLARDLYTAPTGGYLCDSRKESVLWGDLEFEAVDIWSDGVDAENNISAYTTMTTDESSEYNMLQGDLSTYVSTELAKFITGEKNLDSDLDLFIQALHDMGIERCIELQQIAYDRYLNR